MTDTDSEILALLDDDNVGALAAAPSGLNNDLTVAEFTVHTWAHDAPGSPPNATRRTVTSNEVTNYTLADLLQATGRQVNAFGQASMHIVTDKVVVPDPASES